MNNYLVLAIGIPASGKTTAIAKLYKGATIVSPDNFIGYTKQDPWTPEAAKKAWKAADKLLKEELEKKTEVIVFDATLVRPKARKKYIKLAEKYNFIPVALHCSVPLKIAQDRNLKREASRKVPKFILFNMNKNLTPPSHEEGFKKILTFDTNEDKLVYSLAEDFKE
jgi:predicted kinase